MDISTPYNTVHVFHGGFDSNTGEFTGLPKEWTNLLTQSGITRQEQENNPQVNENGIELLYVIPITYYFVCRPLLMLLNFSKAIHKKNKMMLFGIRYPHQKLII